MTFQVNPASITHLQTPSSFLAHTLSLISTARTRITLCALYLDSPEILSALQHALKSTPTLYLTLLLDATRQSRSHLDLSSLGDRVKLYESDAGWLKNFAPARFNEAFGLLHVKCVVVDDEVIVSGANLSREYFTDRQDRYVTLYFKMKDMLCLVGRSRLRTIIVR
jgi:CDP-diacylglycerol--glycerol-3-phosphate 3-phosphatidyltransferase